MTEFAKRVTAASICVIVPYSAQASKLKEELPEKVMIASANAFLGHERDIIILSAVQANPQGLAGSWR